MDIICPFCSFNAFDLIYLLKHIDDEHPDGEHGSFNSEPILGPITSENQVRGDSRLHEICSEVEYVQCECGEHVQLSEFTSHLALHMSEEITSYPNLTEAERCGAFSIRANCSTEPTTQIRSQLRTSSSRRKRSKHADHSEKRMVTHSKPSLAGRCFDSFPSNTRPSHARAIGTAPRRLGVGQSQISLSNID